MPNRILNEGICSSDTIDGLKWFEEVLFYRLLVNCDDYGRFDGRPAIIKNRLFPLKDNLTIKAVSEALNALANSGLVVLYEFEGKPYLYLPTWSKFQTIRAKKSKYPSPEDAVKTSENICKQMQANVPVIQSNSYSYSYSYSESNSENNSTEPQAPSVLSFQLVDGTEFEIFQSDIDEWQDAFPNVDIIQQLKAIKVWCKDNPQKRKTRRGARRFVTGWLDKEQNRGGNRRPPQTQTPAHKEPETPVSWRDGPTYLPDWSKVDT